MADFFRVKIVSKRQVTLPQLMLRDLHLAEGDELEFEVENGKIRAVQALKVVPAEYFPAPVLEMIRKRREQMVAGIDDGEETPRRLDPIRLTPEEEELMEIFKDAFGAADAEKTDTGQPESGARTAVAVASSE